MPFTLRIIYPLKIYFMTKNQRTKSVFKVLVCSLFVTVLTSFTEVDPCKPTNEQATSMCEFSVNETCYLLWTGGTCDGQIYYYPYNRAI